MYKVVSKVLALRLKKQLSKVIHENQFAFLGGRNMLDSVVVLNEVIQATKKVKKQTLLFKVDYEKAYDSVRWEFLSYMMQRMQFSSRWICWIMGCLESATMSVLVNGSPCEEFRIGKGLRQGDPLAPFLFLIVAEGLNGFFSQAVRLGRFRGFHLGRNSNIDISMLQFVDDTIFIPEGVLKVCTGIMRKFLWGGVDEGSKIAWVKWSVDCKPKEHGGLGIKDWRTFNTALLSKWSWRFLNESDSLWCRFVKTRCDVNLKLCGESPWWRDVKSVCLVDGWKWFEARLQKTVLGGGATSFRTENWLGTGALEPRFHWLYNLSGQKYEIVQRMGLWHNGAWHWVFRWRRELRGREFSWLGELMAQHLEERDPVFALFWSAPVPLNIKAFIWRVLLGTLLTRDNLVKRHVINPGVEALCPFCNLVEETCSHLLFSCPVSLQIWYDCYAWLGISTSQIPTPRDHLLQFSSIGLSRDKKLGEIVIWMATTWLIWLLRNRVIFQAGEIDVTNILELIQVKVWQWLRAKVKKFTYSWYEWKMNPLVCLLSI
ncbi:uncharacterized protein LOC130724918 [Lotus japonicus]|uniref:uncharacterized protein LOC130724918 n=1 Tax=Lotus japonicus TaxID=34305 RepID=UPI002586377A|nr:uncharacterized protein LOC130724918 [Lotus japonicus]